MDGGSSPMMESDKPVEFGREVRHASNPPFVWEKNARVRYVAFTRAQHVLLPDKSSKIYLAWLATIHARKVGRYGVS